MLRISRLTDYGTVVLAHLAGEPEAVCSAADVSTATGIAPPTVSKLLKSLARAGLVSSTRGANGGYQLARSSADIMVADVMAAVDERTRMTRCSVGSSIGCVGEERCLTHGLWAALGRHIEMFLADVSLKDVVENGPALQMAAAGLVGNGVGEVAAE